jgi:hypothetical protein
MTVYLHNGLILVDKWRLMTGILVLPHIRVAHMGDQRDTFVSSAECAYCAYAVRTSGQKVGVRN